MAEAYIGEIRLFGGNFAPRAWASCDGQLLNISSNDALFSLLGSVYGGDGRVSFGLPDLRSRVPVHQGHGNGLSNRMMGMRYGVEEVTLTNATLPSHTHDLNASTDGATTDSPANAMLAKERIYQDFDPADNQDLSSLAIEHTGGNRSHENRMPYLAMNFIIALYGIYPSRN